MDPIHKMIDILKCRTRTRPPEPTECDHDAYTNEAIYMNNLGLLAIAERLAAEQPCRVCHGTQEVMEMACEGGFEVPCPACVGLKEYEI